MKHLSWIFFIAIAAFIMLLFLSPPVSSKPGTIILLAGTSSAGKSTMMKKIKQDLGNTYETIAIDDFLLADEDPNNPDVPRARNAMYQKIKELSVHHNVIVDMVFGLDGTLDDTSYEKLYSTLCDRHIISVLVYCPLDTIIERVKKRNALGKPLEERDAMFPFAQFSANYKIAQSEHEIFIDTLNVKRIKKALKEALYYDLMRFAKQEKLSHEKQKEMWAQIIKPGGSLDSFFQEKFVKQLGWNPEINPEVHITSRHPYNLIINTNTETPQANAMRILDYLNSRDVAQTCPA